MDAVSHFAEDYRDARAKFLAAARAADARIETFDNPALGPDGKPLHTDVAVFGDPGADRVLLFNSATHGGEGFCGSGCLVGWLRTGRHRALPPGVRAVLVHAINPHGFAWTRRVTEDNVDLNRNFVDHDAGRWPANPDYATLHAHILPDAWDAESRASMEAAFGDYAARHGEFGLQTVLSQGQYDHGDGVFYGGRAATWSNRTFRTIVAEYAAGARHVGFIDFHTGLGPYGHAELIARFEPGSAEERHYRSWYGEGLTSPAAGNSTSPALHGLIATAVAEGCPDARLTSITAEYGTYPIHDILRALLADNWVHLKGDLDSDAGRAIKANIRKRFYPDEDDWKELVWLRGRQIMDRAARAIAAA